MADQGEEFYLREVKNALKAYEESLNELNRLTKLMEDSEKILRNLLTILELKLGKEAVTQVFVREGLLESLAPFFEASVPARPETRRRGRRKSFNSAEFLPVGSRMRMLVGKYKGVEGRIVASLPKPSADGTDMTYFVEIVTAEGKKKRTTVKHGTMNKSWAPVS